MDKDKVLNFVKIHGPVLPRDVAKQFSSDTFFTGAILSQLVDSKQLKISHAKIGGSPVYYMPGQEEKLTFLYKYLPSKEKEAYDLLREKKILRDIELEPSIRVALRNIKDFAKPFEVNLGDKKEIFWKWFLFSNEGVEQKIREIFEKEEQKIKKDEKKDINDEIKKIERKEEEIEKKKEDIKEDLKEKIKEDELQKEQKERSFFDKINEFFNEKGIEILQIISKKKTDIEMIVKLNTNIGKIYFFCKAKDKKKTNDADLSSLFVQSQMKKLPVLYITKGEITKKAKEMLDTEFKNITLIKI